MRHLQPVISERKANMEEFGEDWSDKPVRLFLHTSVISTTQTALRMICSSGSSTKRFLRTIQT